MTDAAPQTETTLEPSLFEIAIEAFDHALRARISECLEQLIERGVEIEDAKIVFIDHPERTGTIRYYGVAGGGFHATFPVALGFVPETPEFAMQYGEIEVGHDEIAPAEA